MALISVVIPVYNAQKTLKACLESILNQTITPLEIIAVNDGSTDNSNEILNQYRNRLTIIDQANAGAAAARNNGAKIAKSEFIIFIDADSVLKPVMLEKMLKALEKNPQVAYVYCAFKFGLKNFYLWTFDENKLKKMPYIHTSSLMRRQYFPGFDVKLKRFQDWDLYLTMLEKNHIGVFIPEILFSISDTGTMSSWLPKFIYRLPFLNSVKKYREAEKIIREKHKL